jgi:signal transduction histidine kinase
MSRPAALAGLLAPVPDQVETTLFRALAVLRFVVATYAVVLNAVRWRDFEHPVAGWAVVGVIVAWTFLAGWAYDAPRRRTLPLLVADLAVAAATLLSTPYVQSDAMLDRHAATMPSFWVIAAVLAWAVMRGWPGGLAAAVLITLVDLSVRTTITGTTWGNIFLLLLAAGVVGYSSSLIREATEARAEAERIAAVLSERARLARAVHDGVLQVLALVQRRGAELGGDGADLARLAGEQEVALRALVQGSAAASPGAVPGTTPGAAPGRASGALGALGVLGSRRDLMASLAMLGSPAVTVSGPAHQVLLADEVVTELTSVVRAALDNVAKHVGPDAPAWVLVEEVEEVVVVTVRDAGPGIAEGRLDEARGEGRLGVSESIGGRMAALGGTAELLTGPGQGTEWELRVQRRPSSRSRTGRGQVQR